MLKCDKKGALKCDNKGALKCDNKGVIKCDAIVICRNNWYGYMYKIIRGDIMSNLIICKHNELIENFIFNATELELQILNYAVAITNPKWENKNIVYKISVPDLVSIYKTKSNNSYKLYRLALLRLMDRKYSYYDPDGKEVIENLVIRITRDIKDTSYIEFKFNEYVSSRISSLKGFFTSYNIVQIANFSSKYAFFLYEWFIMRLSQIEDSHCTYKKKISVVDFKTNLDILNSYPRFVDLENRVIAPAKTNINTHSDIKISYKVVREGRKPTHIVFTAKYKETTQEKKVVQKKITAPPKNIEVVVPENNIDNSKPISESQRAKGKDHIAKLKKFHTSKRKISIKC